MDNLACGDTVNVPWSKAVPACNAVGEAIIVHEESTANAALNLMVATPPATQETASWASPLNVPTEDATTVNAEAKTASAA
jgi:hypothetical protein